MKVVGFVTEYNPFHYGHKFHLENSLTLTGATHSIAIMSSSFVQRGEPAMLDKWSRAKMAVDNGVDLVIELPFIYSVQSAELFAYGAVNILNSLDVVNYLSFGSELGEIEPLEIIADILNKEPKKYKESLRNNLDKGLSFSVSRSLAVEEYAANVGIDFQAFGDILKQSNNILGIEYIKALKKLDSTITPYAIARQGDKYNDSTITSLFASATGIRNKLQNEGLESVKDLMPLESYKVLEEFYNQYQDFNYLENYNNIFSYIFRSWTKEDMNQIMDMESGLENRIIDKSKLSYDINCVVDSISTKRYAKTRIKRILIHMLAGLKKETIVTAYATPPSYIRILASNTKGLEILNKIKLQSVIPIVTKFADYKYLDNEDINTMLQYEKLATDLFYLGINKSKPITNMDYLKSPYINR